MRTSEQENWEKTEAECQQPLTEEEVMRMAFGYRNSMLAYSYSIMKDWSLAEDVVQEIYISLHQKVRDMEFYDSPYRWLIKSTRLQSLYMRRSRSRETTTEDEDLLSTVGDLFEQHMDERTADFLADRKVALRGCMKQLTDRALRIVVAFYHDSVTCEEMAKRSGQKPTTVRQTLSRAREQLRKCMTRQQEAGELA